MAECYSIQTVNNITIEKKSSINYREEMNSIKIKLEGIHEEW